MPIDPEKLQALIETSIQAHTKRVSLPETWGVLYAHPNPDGSRKACENCMMWITSGECGIHEPGLAVPRNATCGYHVFGMPMDERMEHPGIQYVDPMNSGLEETEEGTSCDICRHFEVTDGNTGICHAVALDGIPADVHPRGCCARWESVGR